MFSPDLLTRCMMGDAERQIFKTQARKSVVKDEETDIVVTAYIHPDGCILIDDMSNAAPSPHPAALAAPSAGVRDREVARLARDFAAAYDENGYDDHDQSALVEKGNRINAAMTALLAAARDRSAPSPETGAGQSARDYKAEMQELASEQGRVHDLLLTVDEVLHYDEAGVRGIDDQVKDLIGLYRQLQKNCLQAFDLLQEERKAASSTLAETGAGLATGETPEMDAQATYTGQTKYMDKMVAADFARSLERRLRVAEQERDDYAERLIGFASVLEPHFRGATPKGTVPTQKWLTAEYLGHIESASHENDDELESLRAALTAAQSELGEQAKAWHQMRGWKHAAEEERDALRHQLEEARAQIQRLTKP